MNKRADSLAKHLEKRVLHAILPKKIWKTFDLWCDEMGFSTTIEGVRYLIRDSIKSRMKNG